ncbi:hypothetical protein PoB_006295300 [Plakobranchus ocellatus]|uniref:Uncharacterized protein n=1 Tax=Plakobranchus ocellatus TaxID=259542 RepID=A0AAV4CX39_9GAST|nr:hypothetical protein PoB_006295300 [Plakobranchus ocellatus]
MSPPIAKAVSSLASNVRLPNKYEREETEMDITQITQDTSMDSATASKARNPISTFCLRSRAFIKAYTVSYTSGKKHVRLTSSTVFYSY